MKKLFLLFSLLFVALTSCNKSETEPIIDPASAKMLILSEGNFTKGNSDLCVIDHSDVVTNDVFDAVNKKPIGDVGQSILYSGGKYYIAVNNSKKVQVISATDYSLIATISVEGRNPIPQYMAEVSPETVVLSDLNEAVLHVIDTKTNTITNKLSIAAKGGKMKVVGNKLFINTGSGIIVLNTTDLSATSRTINVKTITSAQFALDKHSNIWALTTEGLVKINTENETVTPIAITFPTDVSFNTWSARLSIDAKGEKLYFNAQTNDNKVQVYQMGIEDAAPKLLFSPENIKTLYNMEVSPDNKIIICDALDYVQKGYAFSFNLNGTKEKEYLVGIIPQFILFTKYNKN